jgi:hypothetical protein
MPSSFGPCPLLSVNVGASFYGQQGEIEKVFSSCRRGRPSTCGPRRPSQRRRPCDVGSLLPLFLLSELFRHAVAELHLSAFRQS